MLSKSYTLIAFLLVVFMSCSSKFEPQEGDLLFQDMDCGAMCDAIEEVTQGINGARLSHVGLVIKNNDSLFVTEAISAGVILTPLNNFLDRSSDANGNPKVIVSRLKPEFRNLIPKTKETLKQYLGKPYNHSFIWGNDEYYCSQLLYLIFKEANNNKEIFELTPMTFKQPNNSDFFPVWKEYYQKLGIDIPEGEPGCNPGGLSRSEFIQIVHIYGKPDGYQE